MDVAPAACGRRRIPPHGLEAQRLPAPVSVKRVRGGFTFNVRERNAESVTVGRPCASNTRAISPTD